MRDARWQHGVLDLTVETTQAANPAHVRLTPTADRYGLRLSGAGADPVLSTRVNYAMSSAGHWYGHGEAQTEDGGPYTRQPWPLDETPIRDDVFGPASYLMIDPFWFTQSAAGNWSDTREVMAVSLGSRHAGTAGLEVQDADTSTHSSSWSAHRARSTRTTPASPAVRTRATRRRRSIRIPLWNSWAQFYTDVDQASLLAYAQGLHDQRLGGHTIQLDDVWM